jgi:SAM-dependent methyltransferase
VGELSFRLADRCDHLLSCDREPRAVAAATARLAGKDAARAEHLIVPEQWPEGEFDLVVLSEILYYFDAATVDRLLEHVKKSLVPGETLAAVHWRHPVSDHTQSAQGVHDTVNALPWLTSAARHNEPDFLLDVFVRTDGENHENHEGRPWLASVAAVEGLV